MGEKGLDIKPHRKRMIEEDLDEKFKDPENPLRLVFVCAMWMTGFDVPICSTLYLDKPMRNHTLMQTIARANRVYPGKACGLIVDYVGVFRNLEKALAIYAIGNGENKPVEDKKVLIEALKDTLAKVRELCNKNGVNLDEIIGSRELKRLGLIDDTVEALITSENTKRRYLDLVNAVNRLYKGVLPDKEANQFVEEIKAISYIADKIRSLTPPADISDVMQQVEILLDESVASQGYIIGRDKKETNGKDRWIDLSDIDFEELAKKFDKKHKRTLNEKLKASVSRKVVVMVKYNRTRIDYLEKFQEMIDEYNAGSLNAEEFFKRLREFANELDEEDKRTIKEGLSEEELAIFDLLTKPDIKLSEKDRKKVKSAARSLLKTLKEEKLILDWRKHQKSRANVKVTIEEILDNELPEIYTPELFEKKSEAIFQHVYDSYYGNGRSVYTANQRVS
jgi:type I restriction enzyme R subunit